MLYGGSAFASALDRLSDEFRRALAPPAPLAAVEALHVAENRDEHVDGAEHTSGPEPARAMPAPAAQHPVAEGAESEAETVGAVGDEAPPVGSPSPTWLRAALAWLNTVDLAQEFRERLPTMHTVPRFLTTGCAGA